MHNKDNVGCLRWFIFQRRLLHIASMKSGATTWSWEPQHEDRLLQSNSAQLPVTPAMFETGLDIMNFIMVQH